MFVAEMTLLAKLLGETYRLSVNWGFHVQLAHSISMASLTDLRQRLQQKSIRLPA